MSIFGLRPSPPVSEGATGAVPASPSASSTVAPLVTDAQLEALADMVSRRVLAAVTPLVTEAVRAQASQAVADHVPPVVREIATTLVREEIARIRERRP
ncbi:MAG: hypothetical protein FJW29_07355 [Acidobacteria bacterium]|nr:hypothetical protein [Acidobacteriota bacterium]